jgi:glycosyltransferase involved in cell wall biosynthesis
MTDLTPVIPRVSVVIPAYNAAWCVRRAVDSVLAQDYQDFELLVVDDGSEDDTTAILASYGEVLRVVGKINGGLSSARNTGIAAGRGAYVAFLDADDWWHPSKLALQVALLDARPDLMFCSTASEVRNLQGERLNDWCCGDPLNSTLESIFATNAFVAGSGSAVLVRREAFTRVGGFDESLRSLEDIDMWMRLATVGGYACISEALTVIEKRGDSMSGNLDVMRAAAIRVMQKNRGLLPLAKRGRFWRIAYAGMLTDYAKWAYRKGHPARALADLAQALWLAPWSRGRLIASLSLAILRRQKL